MRGRRKAPSPLFRPCPAGAPSSSSRSASHSPGAAAAHNGLRSAVAPSGQAFANVPRRDLNAASRTGGIDGNKRMLGVAR